MKPQKIKQKLNQNNLKIINVAPFNNIGKFCNIFEKKKIVIYHLLRIKQIELISKWRNRNQLRLIELKTHDFQRQNKKMNK